jgi:hypothetical protein
MTRDEKILLVLVVIGWAQVVALVAKVLGVGVFP